MADGREPFELVERVACQTTDAVAWRSDGRDASLPGAHCGDGLSALPRGWSVLDLRPAADHRFGVWTAYCRTNGEPLRWADHAWLDVAGRGWG